MFFFKELRHRANLSNILSFRKKDSGLRDFDPGNTLINSIKLQGFFSKFFFYHRNNKKLKVEYIQKLIKKAGLKSFNNPQDVSFDIQEKLRLLREYANRTHDNPHAQIYAYQLQKIFNKRDEVFFKDAITQATEEIKATAANIKRIINEINDKEKNI